MLLEVISFIYGILSNVIDYMYDSELFLENKQFFELIFVLLTIFFFLYNKYISFFGTGLFVAGGIGGFIFAPHAVDAPIWKNLIYLSIPIFIYHILHLNSLIESFTGEDIKQFIFRVIPIVCISLLFALIEDYIVPEEHGKKKLYDKIFQFVILIVLLYFLNYSSYFQELTNPNLLILNIFYLAWLGNITSGIYILSQLTHLFEKKQIITPM